MSNRFSVVSRVRASVFGIAVAAVSLIGGLRAEAQTPAAPVLIPYTTNVMAGNPQSTASGYSGDNGKAVGTTLNLPSAVAVDSVGNIYVADTSNAVIREINAQTGVIHIVAGQAPTKCTQTLCTATTGYADGVPATSTGIGSGTKGLAVDGFGNIFLVDSSQQAVRVIYKGGAQVANIISLVDSATAPTASSVVPGNIYLLAGTPVSATKGTTGTTDGVLATKALFHNPGQLGLDGQGNVYVQDVSNGVTRVINMQSTTQTFFGQAVQPGYIKAIVGCSAITATCTSNTGIGLPAADALIGAALAGQAVDRFGNVYVVDTKGNDPIYAGVAYAGGSALAHLLNVESGYTATPGLWYNVINASPNNGSAPAIPSALPVLLATTYTGAGNGSLVIRASAITVDNAGNIYYLDNHWLAMWRVDVNSQVAVRMNSLSATTGSAATPVPCSATVTTLTNDTYGDGCPVSLARISGNGYMTTDADGNVYLADSSENLVRKLSVNNQFPTSAVGTAVTQSLQVHFDASNLPVTTTATQTTPLAITLGSADYSISSAPTCANVTSALDASIDCIVSVTFNPSGPGLRLGTLQATAQNGPTYQFTLRGYGTGSRLVVDGGTEAKVNATGLTKPSAVAIDAAGNQYIADAGSNQVVKITAAGVQTTVGTGLSGPTAVAVDAVGNVYIADTGNNQVVKVAGTLQTVLASGLSKPQGVAVDQYGNVYISDTGNVRVLEIPSNQQLAPAVLLELTGTTLSSFLKSPTALAVDNQGNLYVTDPSAGAVFEVPAGGGDLSTVVTPTTGIAAIAGAYTTPDGVAVDAAGDVYVSDSTANVVTEQPSSTGPGHEQFTLSFTGLSSPGGVALDPSGNVYVADSGNARVLEMARTSAAFNFGNLGLYQPALTEPFIVGNIGTASVKLSSPAYALTGAGTTNFTLNEKANENCSGTSLLPGLTCTLNVNFLPQTGGLATETLAVQGGASAGGVSAVITGTAVPPLGQVAVTLSTPPVTGGTTAAVTAVVTQPHGTNTPTGTVTFVYTINEGNTSRGGSTNTVTVPLTAGTGGAASAVLNLTGLLPARRYSVVATYNGDALDTANTATALTFIVPGGITLSDVANSLTLAYGQTVPTLTGTVTGILPADAAGITYQFVTTATSTSPVGVYPITLVLSGGNYLNYVVPAAVTSTGAAATVTITPAPLTVTATSVSTVYGTQDLNYASTITGPVNGDRFTLSYTPPHSSVLTVGTYVLTPILSGPTANYTVKIVPGTLTVTQAAASVAVISNATAVLPTNLSSVQISMSVASSTTGIPTGTVTLTDTFTPLGATAANNPVTIGPLTISSTGAATYVPTSQTFGTHVYTVAYSGDTNFMAATGGAAANLIVDNPDFIVTTSLAPLAILPGILPGGNQNIPGESAATPQTQTISIAPILNYTGTVNLSCSSPSSYVTCSISPASVVISTTTAQVTTISVQTPATLPTNYTGQLIRSPGSAIRFALLPAGLLLLLPMLRGRRKLSRVVWIFVVGVLMSMGLSGCTSTNLVKFFTPVPQGEQPLTITATDGTYTRTITMTINIE